jgi:hypothetical protein
MYLNFGGPPGSRLDRAVRAPQPPPPCVWAPGTTAAHSRALRATVLSLGVRDDSLSFPRTVALTVVLLKFLPLPLNRATLSRSRLRLAVCNLLGRIARMPVVGQSALGACQLAIARACAPFDQAHGTKS